MGVRIDGSNDVVSAVDGTLTVDGLSLNVAGIITASGGFKVGSAYTAFSNGNVETTGIITATSFVGNIGGTPTFSGDITIPDKIIHDGDTNTAIRFPAADTFAVETSGGEALRVDSSKRLVVGADASVQVAGSHAFVQHHGNKTTTNLAVAGYANNLGGPILALGASRSTTVGTPGTIVASGDILGDIRFAGDDGTDINSIAASIRGEVDGAPGSNDMPGRLVFSTTADGAASATERLRIDSSGRVMLNGGAGARANMLNSTFTSQFQIEGTGHTTSSMSMVRNTNDGSSPYLTLGKSRSTSVNGAGLVSSGDGLGVISWQGGDGSNLIEGAAILAQVDGTPGTDDMPGRLAFYTTADGAAAATERLRITSNGTIQLRNSPGIDFSQIQTNAAGMTSETLDSYEEGSWTPVFADSGFTYSNQYGRYTKIGNRVWFNFFLTWTANTASGSAAVQGLPFSQGANAFQYYGACSMTNNALTLPSGANNFVVQISPSTPQLVIYGQKSGDAKQSTPNSNCGSAGEIIMSGHYLVTE